MDSANGPAPRNWTVRLRRRITRTVPPGQWLPDRQPAYVRSWIYVFGVATLAALLVVLASGIALTVGGSAWWHTSSIGHYLNSVHLWSVELFFAFMVIHLWGKFFMAAWRGRRALTWITGAVCFVGSIGTAFTGYLSQSNFDSQWISTQAKDGLNAVGIGAYFNVLNPAQMLLWHVALLPLVVGILVVAHIVLVRRHGVVPPIDATLPAAANDERAAERQDGAGPRVFPPSGPVSEPLRLPESTREKKVAP
jgi:quinol-cytochrome oxidoreductase complex cytochrome b subunit